MSKEWWQEIIASDHLVVAGETISRERTIQEVDFLEKQFYLKKGMSILDVACGNGRHSLELSRRGYDVVGVDYCESLLQLAQKSALDENLPVKFIRADMREIPISEKFDLVLSMWNSLGYFKEEDQNNRSLSEMFRLTKNGGSCFFYLNNPLLIASRLVMLGVADNNHGLVIKKEEIQENVGSTKYEAWFDVQKFRNFSTKTWIDKITGETRIVVHDMRQYIFPELKNILERNGYGEIRCWGDFYGTDYVFNSARLLVAAGKTR